VLAVVLRPARRASAVGRGEKLGRPVVLAVVGCRCRSLRRSGSRMHPLHHLDSRLGGCLRGRSPRSCRPTMPNGGAPAIMDRADDRILGHCGSADAGGVHGAGRVPEEFAVAPPGAPPLPAGIRKRGRCRSSALRHQLGIERAQHPQQRDRLFAAGVEAPRSRRRPAASRPRAVEVREGTRGGPSRTVGRCEFDLRIARRKDSRGSGRAMSAVALDATSLGRELK